MNERQQCAVSRPLVNTYFRISLLVDALPELTGMTLTSYLIHTTFSSCPILTFPCRTQSHRWQDLRCEILVVTLTTQLNQGLVLITWMRMLRKTLNTLAIIMHFSSLLQRFLHQPLYEGASTSSHFDIPPFLSASQYLSSNEFTNTARG